MVRGQGCLPTLRDGLGSVEADVLLLHKTSESPNPFSLKVKTQKAGPKT